MDKEEKDHMFTQLYLILYSISLSYSQYLQATYFHLSYLFPFLFSSLTLFLALSLNIRYAFISSLPL